MGYLGAETPSKNTFVWGSPQQRINKVRIPHGSQASTIFGRESGEADTAARRARREARAREAAAAAAAAAYDDDGDGDEHGGGLRYGTQESAGGS